MTYDTPKSLIEIVTYSFEQAEQYRSKIPQDVAVLRGMSSQKIRHFLNNLCGQGACTYLEIGTWAGSTFIPALYKNACKGISIDNWSQFTAAENGGFDPRSAFYENLDKYESQFLFKPTLIDGDCHMASTQALVREHAKPNVFFYDGNHDSYSTRKSIIDYGYLCTQPFIMVVDDWQLTPSVEEGTRRALEYFEVYKSWQFKKEMGDYHEGLWVAVMELNK